MGANWKGFALAAISGIALWLWLRARHLACPCQTATSDATPPQRPQVPDNWNPAQLPTAIAVAPPWVPPFATAPSSEASAPVLGPPVQIPIDVLPPSLPVRQMTCEDVGGVTLADGSCCRPDYGCVPPSSSPPQIAPPMAAPAVNVGWSITTTNTNPCADAAYAGNPLCACPPGQARLNGYCVDVPT